MAKNKILEAVVNLAGTVDPSLGKVVDEAVGFLESINLKAVAVGAAVGVIATSTFAAVKDAGIYLKDLGEQFDGAADSIRIGTGATGDALEDLLVDFDEIYKSVPTSMDAAGQAVADFNTRLGLTGPELQEISKQAIQVSDMLGDDLGAVIEESSQALAQWDIDAAGMGDAMDYIFKASQSTGMGFTDLMSRIQQYGPQLQEMGYSFEEAAAMMGQLDKAGVNADEVLAAMKKSVGTLAKEGIGASDGLAMYVEQIENAETAAEAAAIANEIFGARAGSTMAAAIRDGSLAIGDLTDELLANQETIAGAADDTYDFAERLQLMKQNLEVALKPMANTVFDGLNAFMPVLQEVLERVIPTLREVVDMATPFVEDFLLGMADALDMAAPMLADLAKDLLPLLSQLMANLLPPLLSLMQQLMPPLMEIVSAILPPISSLLLQILPLITQIASSILPIFADVLSRLMPILTPILEAGLKIFEAVIMPLIEPMMKLVDALLPPLIKLTLSLMPILEPLLAILTPIAEVLGVIVEGVAGIVSWGADKLSGLLGGLFGGGGGDAVPAFAAGGFTDGLSIAGEDPYYPTEAVLSFNPAYRQENLAYWAQAGQMLGISDYDGISAIASGSSTTVNYDFSGFTFAPQVLSGRGEKDRSIMQQLRDYQPELFDLLESWAEKREASRYGARDSRLS